MSRKELFRANISICLTILDIHANTGVARSKIVSEPVLKLAADDGGATPLSLALAAQWLWRGGAAALIICPHSDGERNLVMGEEYYQPIIH